jgi:hypothetical protein
MTPRQPEDALGGSLLRTGRRPPDYTRLGRFGGAYRLGLRHALLLWMGHSCQPVGYENSIMPPSWYRLLNSFVFFWPTEARLRTLLSARAYRNRAHTILVVDTARLIAGHGERVRVSPINSGSTLFEARPRGRATFSTVSDYPYDEMRRRRGPAGAIAEVAVRDGVSPIEPPLVSVTRRKGEVILEELWSA